MSLVLLHVRGSDHLDENVITTGLDILMMVLRDGKQFICMSIVIVTGLL